MLSTQGSGEEAGNLVFWFNFFEGGFLGTADIFGIEAASVKPAPFWWIDGTGDIPFENNPFLFHPGVQVSSALE